MQKNMDTGRKEGREVRRRPESEQPSCGRESMWKSLGWSYISPKNEDMNDSQLVPKKGIPDGEVQPLACRDWPLMNK